MCTNFHSTTLQALEKKICLELAKKFPDSLQKAFDQMDTQNRQKLDREDLKKGIKDILDIKNVHEEELRAFLDKLQLETEGTLDFQQFLVRFGLDFKSCVCVCDFVCVCVTCVCDLCVCVCVCV